MQENLLDLVREHNRKEKDINEIIASVKKDKTKEEQAQINEELQGLYDYLSRSDKGIIEAEAIGKKLGEEARKIKSAGARDEVIANFLMAFMTDDVFEEDWQIREGLNRLIVKRGIPLIDRCLQVHQLLVDGGHTEENQFDFNDFDNFLYYVEVDIDWIEACSLVSDRKAFVLRDQNYDWLIVLDINILGTTLHIRNLWSDRPDNYTDKQFESYTDNVEGEEGFKSRPNLEWYKSIGCTCNIVSQLPEGEHCRYRGYGDCRDKGYILTITNASIGDIPKFDYSKASIAISHLNFALSILEEGED